MPVKQRLARIGLLGGSFDPVHVGHLALGQSAIVALQLDELVLIPAGRPWQKPADQQATPAQRLAMLEQALRGRTTAPSAQAAQSAPSAQFAQETTIRWRIDDQEIRRDGPSYTIDTLAALRQQHGEQVALVLIIGSDQFRNLASWHRWEQLLDFAHLAVTQRERVPLDDLPAPIDALLAARGVDALPDDRPAGSIVLFRMPAVPVSSTLLRRHLAAGLPVDELLPPGVEAYIRQHRLYGAAAPA